MMDEDQRKVDNPARFESAAPPPKFFFLPSNDLHQVEGKNGRPESQRYSTAARKHVMRGEWRFAEIVKIYAHQPCLDIGFKRRRSQRKRTAVAEFDLAVVQRSQSAPPKTEDDAMQLSNISLLTLQHVPTGLESGRLDPFVRWPVAMTKRMRWLLDHCGLSSTFSKILLVPV